MGSIKQFGLSSTAIEEWLPWGGIVRPAIMKQKDGSMFAIFKYEPYSYPADPIALAKIKHGLFDAAGYSGRKNSISKKKQIITL